LLLLQTTNDTKCIISDSPLSSNIAADLLPDSESRFRRKDPFVVPTDPVSRVKQDAENRAPVYSTRPYVHQYRAHEDKLLTSKQSLVTPVSEGAELCRPALHSSNAPQYSRLQHSFLQPAHYNSTDVASSSSSNRHHLKQLDPFLLDENSDFKNVQHLSVGLSGVQASFKNLSLTGHQKQLYSDGRVRASGYNIADVERVMNYSRTETGSDPTGSQSLEISSTLILADPQKSHNVVPSQFSHRDSQHSSSQFLRDQRQSSDSSLTLRNAHQSQHRVLPVQERALDLTHPEHVAAAQPSSELLDLGHQQQLSLTIVSQEKAIDSGIRNFDTAVERCGRIPAGTLPVSLHRESRNRIGSVTNNDDDAPTLPDVSYIKVQCSVFARFIIKRYIIMLSNYYIMTMTFKEAHFQRQQRSSRQYSIL